MKHSLRSVMEFYRSALSVLVLLLYLHSVVCDRSVIKENVTVSLNDRATLPCSGHDSDTVKWIRNSGRVVALCNRTSCQTEEGFTMSHLQFLKGNFSLHIEAVDRNDTGLYECRYEHSIITLVQLEIKSDSYTSVSVEQYHSVILHCHVRCPGLVQWSRGDTSDVVAECDQVFCRSKEGYQIIYDQYQPGNVSLNITEAVFSKRGIYRCLCDKLVVDNIQLHIKPLKSSVHIYTGNSLVLALDVSDPVELMYNSSAAANESSVQICTLHRRSLYCTDQYKHRVFLHSALELSGMNVSDSGAYTLRTIAEKEEIHIYTVNVTDCSRPLPSKERIYFIIMIVSVVMAVIVLFVLVLVLFLVLRKKSCSCRPNVDCIEMSQVSGNEDASQGTTEADESTNDANEDTETERLTDSQ